VRSHTWDPKVSSSSATLRRCSDVASTRLSTNPRQLEGWVLLMRHAAAAEMRPWRTVQPDATGTAARGARRTAASALPGFCAISARSEALGVTKVPRFSVLVTPDAYPGPATGPNRRLR
jgi:hypothetical protein